MPTKWYEAKVKHINAVNDKVKLFTLTILEEEPFTFTPGQFITFDLPVSEKRLQRWRSYSIASAPNTYNEIELCIVKMDGGLATSYLFENVKEGDVLKFKGPDGGFVIPKNLDKINMIMVCTGTGIAPFISMLRSLSQQSVHPKYIHLLFGARTKSDILYQEELEEWSKSYDFFHYDIALSKENDWTSYKGHIHQIYLDKFQQVEADTHFYLCGWSKMIDEAVANLMIKMKYPKSSIHYELYG